MSILTNIHKYKKKGYLLSTIILMIVSMQIISCVSPVMLVGLLTGNTPDPFSINQEDNTVLMMDGIIGGKTLKHFNKKYEKYPGIKTISIIYCPGSFNDEANLILMKRIYDLRINTHLVDNAEIDSGGVDLFLAGVERTRGENVKVGVHSWKNGELEATELPKDAPEHLEYINTYVSVGHSQEWAEEFYFYTINSAPADGIHWMTEDEFDKFAVFTNE